MHGHTRQSPNRTRPLAALAALMLLPLAAQAHNYTYIEGGFLHRNDDLDRPDRDGLRVAGSVDVAAPIALFGEFDHTGDNFDQLGGGVLFHTPVSAVLDVEAGASVEHVDTGPRDDTGFGLRAGVRWQLADARLELSPGVRYVNVLDRSDTSARCGVLFRLSEALDLQGAAQVGDDDRFEVGLRYNFGPRVRHARRSA